MTRLPAAGRDGDPPAWPLSKATKREAVLWERLWHTPQAVQWERLGWFDTVARYARQLAIAEKPKVLAAILIVVQQLEDRLGLTPMAMMRLRWEVSDDAAELEEEPAAGVLDIRDRIKAAE
jgi:hypothetical protein